MSQQKTIGKDYNLLQLAKFCLPAILNELIINLLYTIDDGLFISRYVGPNALAAFSILMPLFMIHNAPASLLGGVSILASRKMGEGKDEEAKSDFTAIIILMLIVGIIFGAIERIFMNPILNLLGTTEIIYPYARDFIKISSLFVPLTLVSLTFLRFYVPAGKPKLELFSTILNVGSNLFFDWYFVVYKGIGMVGTAYANLIATSINVVIGLIFFSSKNCEIGFSKPTKQLWPLVVESVKYGISSFLANMSVAVSTWVSNFALLHWGTESYLAAFSIVNNISFVFMGCYFGLFGTTGPIVSYAVGEKNKEKLLKTFKQMLVLVTGLSVFVVLAFIIFGPLITDLYISEAAKDSKDIINYGLRIAPYSFMLFGLNVGARMTFAALGNHKVSAALTTLQEVFFSNITVLALPLIFGIKGVWFSFLVANLFTLVVTAIVVYQNRMNYGYNKHKVALQLN